MLSKSFILVATFTTWSTYATAQTKAFETREQLWLAYFNQARLTNKSGLWVDLHLRLTNQFIRETAVSIARAGYTYYLTDQVRLTAGYAYVTQYSASGPDVPEQRPWQQIQWYEKKSRLALMQWIRLEERFRRKVSAGELADGYNFNFRVRYNISLTIPLKGRQVAPKVPFVFINDEVHVNFGKQIVYNYFDQNRLSVGLGYQFAQNVNAQLGYMYVFQQLPDGYKYVHVNAIRLFVFHNMDWREKE